MDVEINIGQELRTMIGELSARTGGGPVRIMCNQDTLNQLWEQSGMVYSSDADVENNTGYVARYNGLPIVVAPQVETGKFFLLPDASQTRPIRVEFEDTTNEQPIQVVFDDTPAVTRNLHHIGVVDIDPATIEDGYNDGDVVTFNDETYVWSDGGFIELEHEQEEIDTPFEPVVTPPPEHWWLRSPIGSENLFAGVDTAGYVDGIAFTGPTFDFVDTEPRTIASDLDGVIRKFMTGKGLFSKRNSAKEEQVEIDEDKFLDILGFGKPNVSG